MTTPLHDKLRAARKRAGLNQQQIADSIGLTSHSSVSRIERGLEDTTLHRVDSWVAACGHGVQVVPLGEPTLEALVGAATDLTDQDRDLLRRLAEVLPLLPEPLRSHLAHDVEFWRSEYER